MFDVDETGRKLVARWWLIGADWPIDAIVVNVSVDDRWFDEMWLGSKCWSVGKFCGSVAQRHDVAATDDDGADDDVDEDANSVRCDRAK